MTAVDVIGPGKEGRIDAEPRWAWWCWDGGGKVMSEGRIASILIVEVKAFWSRGQTMG